MPDSRPPQDVVVADGTADRQRALAAVQTNRCRWTSVQICNLFPRTHSDPPLPVYCDTAPPAPYAAA